VFAPKNCSNGLFCDGLETCNPANGACLPGSAPTCDDGQGCTVDSCSNLLGACQNTRTKTLLGTDGSAGNLYRVNPSTGSASLIGQLGFAAPSLATDPVTGSLFAGQGAGVANLYRVNPDTAAAMLIGNAGFPGSALSGLAFNSSGILYAAVNVIDDGGSGADTLAVLNTTTGVGTAIGVFGGGIGSSGGPGGIEGIAFDTSGQLYGTSSRQGSSAPTAVPLLYTINVSTGTATPVAPLLDGSGNPPAGGVVGLDFDAAGTLYGGTGQGTGYLVAINPATAQFTFIGPSVSRSLASLSFLPCGCFSDSECNDGQVCTPDVCNLQTGSCQHDGTTVAETTDLLFDSQTIVSWPATPGAAHWNSYRGTIPIAMMGSRLPGSVYDHTCHESADALSDGATVSTDSTDPPVGTAYYYLSSAESTCGESLVGRSSSGVPIPNDSPCPTPP